MNLVLDGIMKNNTVFHDITSATTIFCGHASGPVVFGGIAREAPMFGGKATVFLAITREFHDKSLLYLRKDSKNSGGCCDTK